MTLECKHESRVFSMSGTGNNSGFTTPWICTECGFEGEQFTPYVDEYSAVKSRFNHGNITK
jgi:hypothetical protein